jgi:hypothetical protein
MGACSLIRSNAHVVGDRFARSSQVSRSAERSRLSMSLGAPAEDPTRTVSPSTTPHADVPSVSNEAIRIRR